MELQHSILLSTIILACAIIFVVIFSATKNKWKWGRIIFIVLSLPVLAALGLWAYIYNEDRPRRLDSFEGIKLGMSSADVIFLKGEPDRRQDRPADSIYIYQLQGGVFYVKLHFGSVYGAGIQDDESDGFDALPWINGIGSGFSYERVLERFGEPSREDRSLGKFTRICYFDKYAMVVVFEHGEVTGWRIQDFKVAAKVGREIQRIEAAEQAAKEAKSREVMARATAAAAKARAEHQRAAQLAANEANQRKLERQREKKRAMEYERQRKELLRSQPPIVSPLSSNSATEGAILEVIGASFAKQVRGTLQKDGRSYLQLQGGGLLKSGTSFPAKIPELEDQTFTVTVSGITSRGYTLSMGGKALPVHFSASKHE